MKPLESASKWSNASRNSRIMDSLTNSSMGWLTRLWTGVLGGASSGARSQLMKEPMAGRAQPRHGGAGHQNKARCSDCCRTR